MDVCNLSSIVTWGERMKEKGGVLLYVCGGLWVDVNVHM